MNIIKEKKNIYKELDAKAAKINRLLKVEIDVTNLCNCKCFFCYQGNEHAQFEKELSFEEIVDLLIKLKKMGCLYLSFSGGEPFCRKDFVDILVKARELGFIVTIVTNLHATNKEQLIRLSQLGITKILVSFHSIYPEKYAAIFGIDPKLYWKALSNIKFLLKEKVNVGIAVTVNEKNITELSDIKRFFEELGISPLNVSFNVLLQGRIPIGKYREPEKMNKYLLENKDLVDNILRKPLTENVSHICSAGVTACVVKANGDVLPCGMMSEIAGNIYKTSIEKIWRESKLFQQIREIKESDFKMCANCQHLKMCPICIATNKNESGDYLQPSESYCSFRKMIISALENEEKREEF